MQTAQRIEPSEGDRAAPIMLLLIRPDDSDSAELHGTLSAIVARYAPMVELTVLSELPENLGRHANRQGQPVVLVLRRGQVVGEAMGTLLPERELDRVVRCAVEWPSDGDR